MKNNNNLPELVTTQDRAAFKEAYYVIADKISTLERLMDSMESLGARRALRSVINDQKALVNNLLIFGNKHLGSWD